MDKASVKVLVKPQVKVSLTELVSARVPISKLVFLEQTQRIKVS